METAQATPKYDLIKKRFMTSTLTEETISPLLKALGRLGFESGSKGVNIIALAACSRKAFDGYLGTIEFLENCTHSKKFIQGLGVSTELVTHFFESSVGSEGDILKGGLKTINWSEAKGAVDLFTAKTSAERSRSAILVIHIVVSSQENNLRRLKWLLKMRFFAKFGKVEKVVVLPADVQLPGVASTAAGGRFQTGFAFVVFECEDAAMEARTAAQHFPWPVSGRFTQASNTFEGMRYHRWQVQLLKDVEEAISQQSGEEAVASVSAEGISLMSTADQLAFELRALQNSLKGGTCGSTDDFNNNGLVHPYEHLHGGGCADQKDYSKISESSAALHRDRKYSPGTKSKIAALLRKSIQEVRLSSLQQADSPARTHKADTDLDRKVTSSPTRSPSADDFAFQAVANCFSANQAEHLMNKIQRAIECLDIDLPTPAPAATKKTLRHSKIEKHLNVSVRTGDMYEVIGWYQEKIKLIGQDIALNNVVNGPDSSGTRTRVTRSDNHKGAGNISWSSFQSFLDALKADVRENRDLSATQSIANNSKIATSVDVQNCARIISALNELALLLIAEQIRSERSTGQELQGRLFEQQDLLEKSEQRAVGLSERLTDAREKVREYSHEIAELEQENRVLSETAVRYELARNQLFDVESLLAEHEQRLASRDNELRAAHASNAMLRQTVEDLRNENSSLRAAQQHQHQHQHQHQPQQNVSHRAPHAPAPVARVHVRSGSYTNRRHYSNHVLSDSNSDADSEEESKLKAAHADRRTSSAIASDREHSRRENTPHHLASKTEPVLTLQSQVTRLASATTSDWIDLYLPRSSTLTELQQTETELAGIMGDLTATLSKFDLAKRELTLCFIAKRGVLSKQEKDKQAAQAADQNLCCICLERTKSVLLMPCRHLCVCQVCSEGPPASPSRNIRHNDSANERHIKSCPVCRAAVKECLKVFS